MFQVGKQHLKRQEMREGHVKVSLVFQLGRNLEMKFEKAQT